jgi:hypothetical protein
MEQRQCRPVWHQEARHAGSLTEMQRMFGTVADGIRQISFIRPLCGKQLRQGFGLGLEPRQASGAIAKQGFVGRSAADRVRANIDHRNQSLEAQSIEQNACRVRRFRFR